MLTTSEEIKVSESETEYKYTFWNNLEWYHSGIWNDFEGVKRKFPQCVAKAEEIGKAWIEEFKKQQEWDKKHPGVFKLFMKTDCPSHKGKKGTEDEESCIEYYLAMHIFNSWHVTTEHFNQEMHIAKGQIDAYYTALVDNPERVTDALDNEKRQYWHGIIARKIDEYKKQKE